MERILAYRRQAISAARNICRDEAAGITRWHHDGAPYGPLASAEFALRGLRVKRDTRNAYRRRMVLAHRILTREGIITAK